MIVVAYLADLGEQLLPFVICSVAVRETFWMYAWAWQWLCEKCSWETDV